MNKVVTGLPNLNIDLEDTYKGCASGKNIKNLFPKSETKNKSTLDLIHSHVCGPMPSISLSEYEYHVTFIDDYSRKTCIYFLNKKSEMFGKFKEFKSVYFQIR